MDINTFFAFISEIVAKIIKMFTQAKKWNEEVLPSMTTTEEPTT